MPYGILRQDQEYENGVVLEVVFNTVEATIGTLAAGAVVGATGAVVAEVAVFKFKMVTGLVLQLSGSKLDRPSKVYATAEGVKPLKLIVT